MRRTLGINLISVACMLVVSYCGSNNNGGGTIAVTGVSLNKTSTTLCVGVGSTTEQLFATVSPQAATNKNVTWSTSADGVATVSADGIVTPVGVGSATIMVTTVDGNKTATCDVAVSEICVAVTGVSLDPKTATVSVGGSKQLYATIVPQGATNQNVTWTSNNDSVATVSEHSGLVTGVSAGNATITVATAQGSFSDTCVVTVKSVTAGTISGTISGWSTFLSNHPDITPTVKIVIKPRDSNDVKDIAQTVSDSYSVGPDGYFTLTPNTVPDDTYLYDLLTANWPSTLIIVSESGVKLLDGPGSTYQAKIGIFSGTDLLAWLRVSPSDLGGEVILWYGRGGCSVNGTINKADSGGDYSMTFSSVNFPNGWSFLIYTVTGTDTAAASIANWGDSWYCVPE
jgi:hypothetical protein